MKYKILALFGKSGSGKDAIQKWMVSNLPNTHSIISCTTRPPREREVNGQDYHFLSEEEFFDKVKNYSMLEATFFRNWAYGTPIESLKEDKINIGVFNIQGIDCLLDDKRLNVLPLEILAYDKERLLRCLKREKNPDCEEICRRFLSDNKDFDDVPFDSLVYANINNKSFKEILKTPYLEEFLKRTN